MEITKVKVYPYKKKFHDVVGVGQVTFDNCLLLTGLELIIKDNYRYVRYPRNMNNKHKLCFCQPLNNTLKQTICNELFTAYDDIKNGNFYDSAIKEVYDDWQHKVATEILHQANSVETCAVAVGDSVGPETDNTETLVVEGETDGEKAQTV